MAIVFTSIEVLVKNLVSYEHIKHY